MAETTLPKLRVNRDEADKKIERQIEKGQWLHDQQISSGDELDQAIMESDNWSSYNTDLLIVLFGSSAPADRYISFNYERLSDDQIGDRLSLSLHVPDFQGEVKEYQEFMAACINSLKGIHERLELYDKSSDTLQSTFGNDVFIVHGHDEAAKQAIAGFVRRFGLNAIILDEQANRGQTIIEKFEENADEAGFAIVLLTPDDVGAPKDKTDEFKPRARQNVVLELGYFMGKLGRERVCPLFKGGVEKPSDIDGVVYVPMDSSNGWQLKLGIEMKQAGLPIDLNELAQG